MAAPAFHIVVKPHGFGFALFNEASGAICGPRLYIGEDEKQKKQLWPFREKQWVHHETEGEAKTAASRLQEYLDARTSGKTKKSK